MRTGTWAGFAADTGAVVRAEDSCHASPKLPATDPCDARRQVRFAEWSARRPSDTALGHRVLAGRRTGPAWSAGYGLSLSGTGRPTGTRMPGRTRRTRIPAARSRHEVGCWWSIHPRGSSGPVALSTAPEFSGADDSSAGREAQPQSSSAARRGPAGESPVDNQAAYIHCWIAPCLDGPDRVFCRVSCDRGGQRAAFPGDPGLPGDQVLADPGLRPPRLARAVPTDRCSLSAATRPPRPTIRRQLHGRTSRHGGARAKTAPS